jgi:pimeloyl-ACP methyl ester carboxylesterase
MSRRCGSCGYHCTRSRFAPRSLFTLSLKPVATWCTVDFASTCRVARLILALCTIDRYGVQLVDTAHQCERPRGRPTRALVLDTRACAHAATFDESQVARNPLFLPSYGVAAAGYDLFIVQYLSEGTPGVPQAVTALFYLPKGGARDVPIAAVSHPANGIGPSCGPTHDSSSTDQIAVPLVGRGYAVVATDYAGMGVDSGMISYLNGASEAAANLDALRALRRFREIRFDGTRLGTELFVLGHSQGGHAALFTQQHFQTNVGVSLLGSISFAPGLGSANSFSQGFSDASKPGDALATFGAMALYAHMLYMGGPDASTWLSPSAQALLPGWFHDQCLFGLLSSVASRFATQGDLYQTNFVHASRACTSEASCAGFEPWASTFAAEQPGNFTSTTPALIMQGDADTVVPSDTTACIVQRLSNRSTPVQACSYARATHTTIVGSALPDAIRWMAARRTGATPSVCPAPLTATCAVPNPASELPGRGAKGRASPP